MNLKRFRDVLRCPCVMNEPKDSWDLRNHISMDFCPDCQGDGFWRGPQGGLSLNVYCRSAKCRSAFNITAWRGDLIRVERVGKAPDEAYAQTRR